MKTYTKTLEDIFLDFNIPESESLSLIESLSEEQKRTLYVLIQKIMIRISVREMIKKNV